MQYTSTQYETFWTSELDKVTRSGNRLRAACPIHGGDSPNTLSVNLATGFAHCFKCNGDGEGWSMIDFAMLRHGLSREAAAEYVRDLLGNSSNGNNLPDIWPFPFPRPNALAGEVELGRLAGRIANYANYLDVTATPGAPGWEAYALYAYPEIKACKTRFHHKESGAKRLCWFALTEKGGWKNPTKMGLQAPPYRASSLAGAKEIWLLNGEKAVDRAIEAWSLCATCLPNGESHWRPEYLAWFRTASVIYLVMDNDPTGAYHGKLIGAYLTKAGIATRLVELPGLPPKGDLFDYVEAGGTEAACRRIAEGAPLSGSEPPAVKEKRARMPPIESFGELDGSEPDLLPYEFTDTGNAQRLARNAGKVLRYARELDSPWLYFDKTHWRSGNVEVAYQPAQDMLHLLQKQAARLASDTAEKIWRFANNRLNAGGIHAMLDLARGLLRVNPNEFDQQPYLVNCINGTFDLKSGEFRPHRPEDLLTRCFPYAYDPNLPAPEAYLKALDEWMGGGPDASESELAHAEEMSAYIRRLTGATLIGNTRYKFFVVIFGGGNNGKTTFITIQQAILGPYAVTVSPSMITKGWNRNQNNTDADTARTRGARAVYVAEPSEKHFDQGQIKKLTQGDAPIVGVFKGKQPFEFLPTATLIIEVNELPSFDAGDRAFTDRMHLLHFSRSFPISVGKTQRDLIWPELAQIFNMQIRDAREVIREGLGRPLADAQEQLKGARDRQARENDGLEPFLEEYFVFGPDEHCSLAEIEALYRPWSEHHRLRVLPRNHLSRQLCERAGIMRGNDSKNHKEAAWLKGLALKPSAISGKAPTWKEPTDD